MNYLAIELAKIHEHHHTKSCKKRKGSHFRYFFPMPPMRSTKVIEPIGSVDDTLKEKSLKLLYSTLEKKQFDNNSSFD